MDNKKLQAKDLINVGIFTAVYFVLFFAGAMLGYIPVFIPLLGLVDPIICGIPFMLFLTKVKKFGMVSLCGIILGLLTMVMGSGVLVFVAGVIFGIAADLMMKAGNYKSWKHTLIGNGVFSLWIMGFVSRMFLTRTEFFSSIASSYGQEYVDTLMAITPGWTFPMLKGAWNFILGAAVGIYTHILPGFVMGYYLIESTTVSEFVAAMERMRMPKNIVIPISVVFRFFPTVKEEYSSISHAMKMRVN